MVLFRIMLLVCTGADGKVLAGSIMSFVMIDNFSDITKTTIQTKASGQN